MGILDTEEQSRFSEPVDTFAKEALLPPIGGSRSPALSRGAESPPPGSLPAQPSNLRSLFADEPRFPTKQDELDTVGQNLAGLQDDNPEQNAKNQATAKASGLPLPAVESDPEGAAHLARIKQSQKILEESPILRNMAQEPAFLRAIQDDIDGLSWWETTWRGISFGFQAGKDTTELGELGIQKARGEITTEQEARILELQKLLGPSGGGALEAAAKIIGQQVDIFPRILAGAGVGAIEGGAVALAAGQIPPLAAFPEELITVPIGAARGAQIGASTILVKEAQRQEGGHVFLEMLEAGVDRDNARLISEGVGAVNGILELVGVSAWAAPFKKQMSKLMSNQLKDRLTGATKAQALKNALTTYTKAVALETGTEVVQELVSLTGEEFAKVIDEKQFESLVSSEAGRKEILDRMFAIMEEVGKGMSILAIPGATITFVGDSNKAQKAQEHANTMEALGGHADGSISLERVPEQYQEYVKEATKNGPVKDVYIDAAKFQEYFQEQGINAEEILESIPEVEESLDVAVQAGQDIRIPIEAYATKIAPTEHHAELLKHSRFDPSEMTPFEAEEFVSTQKEKFEAEAQKVVEEQGRNQEFEESADLVRATIKDQILGREGIQQFPAFVAEADAELFVAYAISMAGKLGVLPHEVFERMGLTIQTAQEEGDVLTQEALKVTQTPEFQSFFEGSQVVDEQGQPQVVFKGMPGKDTEGNVIESIDRTTSEFPPKDFKPRRTGRLAGFFSSSSEVADRFAGLHRGGNFPVFLDMKNPFIIDAKGRPAGAFQFDRVGAPEDVDSFFDALENPEFDGVIIRNTEQEGDVFVPKTPSQIKSIFNRGTFDPSDPDILNQGPVDQRAVLRNSLRAKTGAMILPVDGNNQAGQLIVQGESGPETINDFEWSPDVDAPNFGMPERRHTIPDGDLLLRPTNTIPGRQSLHDQIEEEFFKDIGPIPTDRKPIVYIMGGGAASGKGTVVRRLRESGDFPEQGQVPAIDADEIKLLIPEYKAILNRGDSRAADITHEESSELARKFEERSLNERRDLIVDRTLGSKDQEKIARQIQKFKDQDYTVRIIGVSVDTQEAVVRAESRATQNGRFVPISRLMSAHKEFSRNHALYAEIADHFVLYNNMGKIPSVMAEKVDGSIDIIDPLEYGVFVTKQEGNENAKTLREIQPKTVESSFKADASNPGERLGRGSQENQGRAGKTGPESSGSENEVNLPGIDPRLFQGKKGKSSARGSIAFPEPDFAIISLFENADLSTFLHESAHFFFENYRVLASQADTPQAIKDDMQKLLDFVGVDNLDTWNSLSFEERRAAHEQVAVAFEKYLFEGKAPSQSLRRLFQTFRSWFAQIYKNLTSLNVNLTPEVRGVFDRMLATDEQIDLAKRKLAYEPIFTNSVDAGMTEQEWAEYTALVNDEDQAGKNELSKRSVQNMQWLSRAKGTELRKLQRKNREVRKDFRKQAEVDVSDRPVYKAKAFLSGSVEKVKKIKSDKTKITPEVDSLFTAIAKLGGLNKEEVVGLWGVDPEDKFKSGSFGKPVLRKRGGIPVDQMAEKLAVEGFLPVDENGKADVTDLEDKFFEEHAGNKKFSTLNEEFAFAEEFEALVNEEGIDTESTKHGKLSIPILQRIYGTEEDAIWRQLPKGRFGVVAEEGFHPDLVAETFGFSSGDEMIKAILEVPPLNEAIEAQTDQRLIDVFGDLNDPEALELAVNEALHNKARTKMVHTELRSLSKRVGSGNVLRSAAKEFAENRVRLTKVRNLKPFQFQSAERRAGKKAFEELAKGNQDDAVIFKRTEVINHHFAREALKAQDEIEKAVRFFKKFDSPGTRKNLDPDYLDQIDKLLEMYEFRKVSLKEIDRRKSLSAWIAEQEKQGLDPVIDERLLENLQKKNFKEATVEELFGLRDAVKNIEHLGRLKNKLLAMKRLRDLETAVDFGVKSIEKHSRGKKKGDIEPRLPKGNLARQAGKFFAAHRKLASFSRQMDGFNDGGPMWELFVQPLNRQTDIEAVEREKATIRFGELFDIFSKDEMAKMYDKTFFDFLDTEQVSDKSLSRSAILSIALNWGNLENRQRIVGGYKWSPDQVAKILDTLTEKDWNFVKGVWAYVNEFWPQIEAKEKRVTGVAPEKVEAAPFETRFGTMPGGYYPIVYDSLQDNKAYADAKKESLERAMKGNYTRQTTKRNHVKERVENVKRPVRLDFGVMFEHVDTVIHDLAFHEYLIDATRLLSHERMQDAIQNNYGRDVFQLMNDTIKDVAAGEIAAQNWMERQVSWIRQGSSIAAMGWNFGTAFLQPLGLTVSMSRIGPKWVAKGLSRWLTGGPGMEGGVSWIHEQSPFMRLRHKTFQREINEIRNEVGASVLQREILGPARDSFFWMIAKAQMVADVPTWLGQYEKSMAAGETESQAIALADQAVLDSQGGGQIKDLARVQRGNEFARLFTNFYSYFNVVWNNNSEAFRRFNINDPISIGRLASDLFFINILPAALTFILREALIKGECDHGTDIACSMKKVGQENASYILGQLVGIRELSGAAAGFTGYEGPAGSRIFAEGTKLIIQAAQLEADAAFMKALNGTAGIFLHYPAGQVERIVVGIMKLENGQTKNPLAPVFGVSHK